MLSAVTSDATFMLIPFTTRSQDAAIDAVRAQLVETDSNTIDVLTSHTQQIAGLKQEVARLNAALSVLTQHLIERNAVDSAQLAARFTQTMAASQAQANLVTCARCRKQVDKRTTMVSTVGTVCDPCHRALMADE